MPEPSPLAVKRDGKWARPTNVAGLPMRNTAVRKVYVPCCITDPPFNSATVRCDTLQPMAMVSAKYSMGGGSPSFLIGNSIVARFCPSCLSYSQVASIQPQPNSQAFLDPARAGSICITDSTGEGK